MELYQGDIIKISGFSSRFLIISKNSFIRAAQVFHVCPILKSCAAGPLHIKITGQDGEAGTAVCEQLKLIDPAARSCIKTDRISYDQIMNISDAIQGIFEYD